MQAFENKLTCLKLKVKMWLKFPNERDTLKNFKF